MRGRGPYAAALAAHFAAAARRAGLADVGDEPVEPTTFRRPTDQLALW